MNVIPAERLSDAFATADADTTSRSRSAAIAARSTMWPQLGILTAFWVYVMLSNVLYALSMSATLDPMGSEHFFASWQSRVLQHLMLYPVLIACVWGSRCIGWRPAWRTWPPQVALAVFFSALGSPFLVLSELLVGREPAPVQHVGQWSVVSMFHVAKISLWVASTTSFLLAYGFCLALIVGYVLVQRFRDSELRLAALERAWSSARLAALRMQLSPHTLFNLLHTIRGHIEWDPKSAQAMVVQLADLLRRLLNAGVRDFTRLSDELQFVRLYLELQQKRFPDRLAIELPPAEDIVDAWVPSLILQPLVENAVVHGLAGHQGAVKVRLAVGKTDDTLVLRVTNSTAPSAKRPGTEGIGLNNVRERLAVQFE